VRGFGFCLSLLFVSAKTARIAVYCKALFTSHRLCTAHIIIILELPKDS
jgi:hypothetical protein